MGKQRRGECVYCGAIGPLTEDHIPPRCLFSSPTPSDLIKVPACTACNQGASLDDEYFRMLLVFKETAGDHTEAQKLLASVLRSLEKPEKRRYREVFLQSVQFLDVPAKDGQIRQAGTYPVDYDRMKRVVERIVRGLHWSLRGRPIGPAFRVQCIPEYYARWWSEERTAFFRDHFLTPVLSQPTMELGRGAFSYHVAWGEEPPVSGWMLRFYGDVWFAARIYHPDRDEPHAA